MASTNIRFMGGYQSKGATASATATTAGYDPQNAVDLTRYPGWKGVGTGSQRLVLHATASIAPTALCIAAGNYSGWGTTKLQHSPDGSSWTDFLTLSGLPGTDTLQDYYAVLTAAPSKPYWGLLWGAPSAVPQLGAFYLGASQLLTYNPWAGFEDADDYGVELAPAQDRSIVAEKWGRVLLSQTMPWDSFERAARDEVRDFLRGEGGPLRPFWYAPRDDAAAVTAGRAYLVRMRGTRFAAKEMASGLSAGLYSASLGLDEEA